MKPDVVEPSAYIPQEHGSAAIWSSLTEDTGPVTAVVMGRSSSYVNLVSAINFDWLIDWKGFYAVSAIFQPCNSDDY